MPRIVVDDVEQHPDASWRNWGDVLKAIDAGLTATGRIVTAASFDGLDEPAFRDPGVMVRQLDDLAVVCVETGTSADLVMRCLQEASTALEALRASASSVGDAFRRHDIVTANTGLADLARGLQALIAIVQAISLAVRVDLEDLRCHGQSASEMIADLSGYVESIIPAQRAEDWVSVADVIEYDVEPALRKWQSIFEAFGSVAMSDTYEAAS